MAELGYSTEEIKEVFQLLYAEKKRVLQLEQRSKEAEQNFSRMKMMLASEQKKEERSVDKDLLQKLQNEKKILEEDLVENSHTIGRLQQDLKRLKKDVDFQSLEEISLLQNQIIKIRDREATLRKDLEESHLRAEQLEKGIEYLRAKLSESKTDRALLQEQLNEALEMVAKAQEEALQKGEDSENYHHQYKAAIDELSGIKQQLEAAKTMANASRRGYEEALEQWRLSEAKAELLQQEVDNLKKQQINPLEIEETKRLHEQEKKNLLETHKKEQQEVDRARRELEEETKRFHEEEKQTLIQAHKEDQEEAHRTRLHFEEETKRLHDKEKKELIDAHREEQEGYARARRHLEEEIARHLGEKEELAREIQEKEKLKGKIAEIQARLEESEGQTKVSQQHLAKKLKEMTLLQDDLEKEKSAKIEAERKLNVFRTQVKELETNLDISRRREEEWRDTQRSQEAKQNEVEKKITDLRKQSYEQQQRIISLENVEKKYNQLSQFFQGPAPSPRDETPSRDFLAQEVLLKEAEFTLPEPKPFESSIPTATPPSSSAPTYNYHFFDHE